MSTITIAILLSAHSYVLSSRKKRDWGCYSIVQISSFIWHQSSHKKEYHGILREVQELASNLLKLFISCKLYIFSEQSLFYGGSIEVKNGREVEALYESISTSFLFNR